MQRKYPNCFFLLLLCCFFLSSISISLGTSATVFSKNANPIKAITPSGDSNVNNIKLNMRSMKLVKGEKKRLSLTNSNANYIVTYSTSNKSIASVDKYGYVSGKKNGSATVTATIKYKNRTVRTLTCSIWVGPSAISIVIPRSKITMKIGESCYIKYIIKPSNTVEVPTFTSSNPKIASVSSTGKITSCKSGTVTITAKIANGKYDTCKIIVNNKKAGNKPAHSKQKK